MARNTAEDVARRRVRVRELFDMGLTNPEMVDSLGVSMSTITGDLTAMGLTRHDRRRTNGKTVTSPVQAMGRALGQLVLLAEQIDDILGHLTAADYRPPPDLLEEWEATLSARDNPGAVIQRVRRYVQQHKEQLTP